MVSDPGLYKLSDWDICLSIFLGPWPRKSQIEPDRLSMEEFRLTEYAPGSDTVAGLPFPVPPETFICAHSI
jgi:hypothetical protein